MASLLSSGLRKRILSALVVAPIVIWMIWAGGIPFVVLVVGCVWICLHEWFFLSLKTSNKILFMALGVVYVPLTFFCCYLIRMDHSLKSALLFIIMVWASDIGAYVTGKMIGGPKMAVNISPNKTWAGFGGAVFFPGVAGTIFVLCFQYLYSDGLTPGVALWLFVSMMIIGFFVGVVGQAGDLLISAFKRYVRVKDTGDLMPGHGGLLDRVDALMLAAPVFLFFVANLPNVFAG